MDPNATHSDVADSNNYLELTPSDYGSVKPEDMASYESLDSIMKEYRSFDCVCCNAHFGYQHRKDPNIKLCSSRCLAVVDCKLRTQGGISVKFPKMGLLGSIPSSPNPDATRIGMGSACLPIVTSSERRLTAVQSEQSQVNGNGILGSVPSYGSSNRGGYSAGSDRGGYSAGSDRGGYSAGSDRGGYSNGSDRGGGRGGGFSSRGGGLTRGTTRMGGSNERSSQESLRGGWQNPLRSTDETDAKLESSFSEAEMESAFVRNAGKGKENAIPSQDSSFKPLQMDRKEDLIRSARECAKLTKPSVGAVNISRDSAPVPKPLSTLTRNNRAEPELQPVKTPVPIRTTAPIATETPLELARRPQSTPSPAVLKKPENVTRPPLPDVAAPALVKKTWTINDLIPSLSLVNQAECTFSFMWGITKYTINAVADLGKLEKLQADIAASSGTEPLKRVPAVDDIVIAPYSEELYRGRVDKVDEKKGELHVVFIDYGDSATVKLNECREPNDKIMRDNPIYGLILNLNINVPVPASIELSEEIQKIVDENTLYLQTDLQSDPKREWRGTLFLDKEGKVTFNAVIEKHIIAQSPTVPSSPAIAPVKKEESVATPPVQDTKKPELPAPASPALSASTPSGTPSRPSSVNPFAAGNKKIRNSFRDAVVSPHICNGAVVRINFVWNDAMINISAESDDAGLDILADLIAKYVDTAPSMTRKPDVDEIVIAPYNDFYYRGRVKAVNGDDVHVIFVDWGDQCEVSYKECKEMTPDIAKHPVYGVIFRMADVPETQLITENNAEFTAALETTGQIQLMEPETKVVGELTGILWLGADRSWNDIAVDVMKAAGAIMEPKDTWNPWSYEVFGEICGGKFPDEHAAYDESLYVSKLDELLIEKLGPDYLLTLTMLSYEKHLQEAKSEVINRIVDEKDEGEDAVSAVDFHRLMGRIDLVDRKYTKNDIPPLPIPVGTRIHLKVAKFEDMDKFAAYPMDEPFFTYRRRLCRMLEEYCEDPNLEVKLLPRVKELAFVKVPSWKEIDFMMRLEKGKYWKGRYHRRTNEDDDGWMAGKWFRGICVGECSYSNKRLSDVYEFYLVDVGRNVAIHKSNIRSGVLRFASIPALSIKGVLLLQSMKPRGEDELTFLPRLTPEEMKIKWYSLFARGTVFPCTVLYHIFDTTVVIMPAEIEEKFDKIYEEKYEEELGRMKKQTKPLQAEDNIENYLINLDDLNFD